MSARKSTATKSTAKKSAATKAAPSHPTWADMIKVSLPFIVTCHLLAHYYAIYIAHDAIVSVVCRNWQGEGQGVRARNSYHRCYFSFIGILNSVPLREALVSEIGY